MFWTQAKCLYLNFNLSFEYRMYANRIRILKSKFENSNFVSHPYMEGIAGELKRDDKIFGVCVSEKGV